VKTGFAFKFTDNDHVWISVPLLYTVVADAWTQFDKAKIKYAIETFR
jgi:hypothetical protein